ncbi:MAG TPA: hypothetical protein DDW52_21090 [Planctomycetaceae bacterium]|nr:hypothetical protein [Planctomycetaceae bacterium]
MRRGVTKALRTLLIAGCACAFLQSTVITGHAQLTQQTAGMSDVYRQPMKATDLSGTPSAPNGTNTGPSAVPVNYQPPSVSTLPRNNTLPGTAPPVYPAAPTTIPGTNPAHYNASPYSAAPYSGQTTPPPTTPGYPPPGSVGTANTYPAQPPYSPGPLTGVPNSPSDLQYGAAGAYPSIVAPGTYPPPIVPGQPQIRTAPIDINLQETRRSGRFIIGGTVNSDLGVAGHFILEERNFDFTKLAPGPGFLYGGNQHLRIEAMPGTEVQRYAASWTQPNLFGVLPYSLTLGGFYYTRDLRDWSEQRGGGRIAMGYEITRNLSISGEMRAEDVTLFDPRIGGVADLDDALGSTDAYRGRVRLTRDTRDSTFLTTRGGLLELTFDQVFGENDYSRGNVYWSRYFPIGYNPDPDSAVQTLSHRLNFGVTGSSTPIFDNYFAGGFSTIRGFEFRGASPREMDVEVGGELQLIGNLEWMFPLTADGMLRGVAFTDYGTVERDITISGDNFRTSVGLGLRLNIPAFGPAPLAVDFAYPVLMADTDERQLVSFYVGAVR